MAQVLRVESNGLGRLMAFGKSRAKLLPLDNPKTTFEDVAGADEAKLELEMFVDLKINKFNDLRRTKVMWKREGYVGLQFLVKIDKGKDTLSEFFKIMESR